MGLFSRKKKEVQLVTTEPLVVGYDAVFEAADIKPTGKWKDEVVQDKRAQDILTFVFGGQDEHGRMNETAALVRLTFAPTSTDKTAIKVTVAGLTVGYIYKEDKSHISPKVKAFGTTATCMAGWGGGYINSAGEAVPLQLRMDLARKA